MIANFQSYSWNTPVELSPRVCQGLILKLRSLRIDLHMECYVYLKISDKNVLIWGKYMCVYTCYVCACVYIELNSNWGSF